MKNITEFNLKTFQSEVFDEFGKIKATIGVANFYSKGYGSLEKFKTIAGEPDLKNGLFVKAVLNFFSFLGKKAKTKILNKPDFIELQTKAAQIAGNPKIKMILRPALKREIRSDLSKEAVNVKLIKVITVLLTRKEIVKEFSIEPNTRLFSLIALKILQSGISNYCR